MSNPLEPNLSMDRDDWEAHWELLSDITELNPADAYRYQLVLLALGLEGDGTGARVLDVGCGPASLLARVASKYPRAELVGVDFSRQALSLSASKVPSGTFLQVDLADSPASLPAGYRGWATHAICSEVIEHLDDPVSFLRVVKHWLRPNATLVVTVPSGPMADYHRHVGHRRHYKSHELAQTLSEAGYTVTGIQRAGFPFFNLYRLLTQLRGSKLIHDVSVQRSGRQSLAVRVAFGILRPCFLLNLRESPLGWQLLATAMASPTPAPSAKLTG